MGNPITCIPTYDVQGSLFLKSSSSGMFLRSSAQGEICMTEVCSEDARWTCCTQDGHATLKSYSHKKTLGLILPWQNIGTGHPGEVAAPFIIVKRQEKDGTARKRKDGKTVLEVRWPGLKTRLACSPVGTLYQVPCDISDEPEDCQWTVEAVGGKLCYLSCDLGRNRIARNKDDTLKNQVCLTAVQDCDAATLDEYGWRLIEVGDGSVLFESFDYEGYLAADVCGKVFLTRSGRSCAMTWSIVRDSYHGVRIKSNKLGSYLGREDGRLLVSTEEEEENNSFLWSLDPVHGGFFNVLPDDAKGKTKKLFIHVLNSNGDAIVKGAPGLTTILQNETKWRIRCSKNSGSKVYIQDISDKEKTLHLTTTSQGAFDKSEEAVGWELQAADDRLAIGVIPKLIPQSLRKHVGAHWLGHSRQCKCTFDIPPELRRPFADWRNWSIEDRRPQRMTESFSLVEELQPRSSSELKTSSNSSEATNDVDGDSLSEYVVIDDYDDSEADSTDLSASVL